jgi:hypothetical protein
MSKASVAALCVMFLTGLGGCFSPKYSNGTLHCAAGPTPCPDGYYCTNGTCWQNGQKPPRPPVHIATGAGAGISIKDGMATDHGATIMIGVPLSTTAKPAVATDHTVQFGLMRNAVTK